MEATILARCASSPLGYRMPCSLALCAVHKFLRREVRQRSHEAVASSQAARPQACPYQTNGAKINHKTLLRATSKPADSHTQKRETWCQGCQVQNVPWHRAYTGAHNGNTSTIGLWESQLQCVFGVSIIRAKRERACIEDRWCMMPPLAVVRGGTSRVKRTRANWRFSELFASQQRPRICTDTLHE